MVLSALLVSFLVVTLYMGIEKMGFCSCFGAEFCIEGECGASLRSLKSHLHCQSFERFI